MISFLTRSSLILALTLAPNQGRCHTFDRAADGYVRAEASCAILVESEASRWPRLTLTLTLTLALTLSLT